MGETGDAFDRRANALRATGDATERSLTEATAAVDRQVANLLAAAERAAVAVGRAGTSVTVEHDRLNTLSAGTVQNVDSAAASLRALVALVEMDAQSAVRELAALADNLRERQSQIGEAESEASRRLGETRRAVEEAGAALSAAARSSSDRINLSSDELKQRAAEIESVLTSAAERVAGRIQTALVAIAQRIEQTDALMRNTESGLTTTLSSAVAGLSRKIEEMQEAGKRATTVVAEARDVLNVSSSHLEKAGTIAETRIGAASENVRREAKAVLLTAVEASEQLNQLTQHFESRLEGLTARLAQVQSGAATTNDTLTSHVAVLTAAADDIRKRMGELGPVMDEMMSLLKIRLAGAAGHVTTSGEALAARSDEIARSIANTLSQLGAAGDAATERLQRLMTELAAQSERVEVLAHRAEARVATATTGLQTYAERANDVTTEIQRLGLMRAAESREQHRTLAEVARALAAETERVMEALREHATALSAPPPAAAPAPETATDEASYLARSATTIRSLEALSSQIGGKLLPEPHGDLRLRFERGDRTAYARAMLNLSAGDFKRLYEEKPDLRIAVEMYLHDFEALVGEPARLGLPAGGLNGLFLNSDLGRLYAALARGTGKV
jgi:hypothetical protein